MTNKIFEIREKFFDACRDTNIETQHLTAALQVIAQENPGIFDEHQHANYLNKPEYEWNEGFFEQCVHESREVFSEHRLVHLLRVREYLRKMGAVGFKPISNKIEIKKDIMKIQFQPKKNLESCFNEKDFNILKARIALRFEIYDFSNNVDYLTNAVGWAESKDADIFLPHEVSPFYEDILENETEWNPRYFDINTEYLGKNFSKKRYLHLIKVRQYLSDKGVEGFAQLPQKNTISSTEAQQPKQAGPEASKPGSAPHSTPDTHPNSMSSTLRTALMIGGAIAALLVLVFSITR
jgi:hypothetical protein